MNELREDLLTGRQVMMAPDRVGRPSDLAAPAAVACTKTDDCPFCAGHERYTPHETWRWPADGAWLARVVPNKYPAVAPLADDAHGFGDPLTTPLTCAAALSGRHEVIVESPRHVTWMSDLTDDEWTTCVRAWQARLAALAEDTRLPYRMLFKNVGLAGGASLAHVHSQCLALPWLPPGVAAERDRAARLYERHGRCATCQMLEAELAAGTRIVHADEQGVLLCPYASRMAGELWWVPRQHASDFGTSHDSAHLAAMLRRSLMLVERVLPGAGYNVLVVTSSDSPALHWRIEIVPRTTSLAGLELMTGLAICTVLPEAAAERYRQ